MDGLPGIRFGDPFSFTTVQGTPGRDQDSGPFTWFKGVVVGTLLDGRWDVTVSIAIPTIGTKDFMGAGRGLALSAAWSSQPSPTSTATAWRSPDRPRTSARPLHPPATG